MDFLILTWIVNYLRKKIFLIIFSLINFKIEWTVEFFIINYFDKINYNIGKEENKSDDLPFVVEAKVCFQLKHCDLQEDFNLKLEDAYIFKKIVSQGIADIAVRYV